MGLCPSSPTPCLMHITPHLHHIKCLTLCSLKHPLHSGMHHKFRINHFSCPQHKIHSDPHNFLCSQCRIQITIKQIPQSIALIFILSQPILSPRYLCWEFSLDLGGACNQNPQRLPLKNMKKNLRRFNLMRIWERQKKKKRQLINQLSKLGQPKLLKILPTQKDLP